MCSFYSLIDSICNVAVILPLNYHYIMKYILYFLIVLVGCQHYNIKEDPTVWKKVSLDFKRFDKDGLAGPPGGKIAASYEFCIPVSKKMMERVKKIDPTAQRSLGKGRIGCTDGQWLMVGSTHQPNFQRVLFELASLPFVKEIQETFYE